MGAEAAVNAVYAGKLEQIADARARAEETDVRRDYDRDIDILRLAAELVIDDIVEPEDLRTELVRRFAIARAKPSTSQPPRRKHGISLLPDFYLLLVIVPWPESCSPAED